MFFQLPSWNTLLSAFVIRAMLKLNRDGTLRKIARSSEFFYKSLVSFPPSFLFLSHSFPSSPPPGNDLIKVIDVHRFCPGAHSSIPPTDRHPGACPCAEWVTQFPSHLIPQPPARKVLRFRVRKQSLHFSWVLPLAIATSFSMNYTISSSLQWDGCNY